MYAVDHGSPVRTASTVVYVKVEGSQRPHFDSHHYKFHVRESQSLPLLRRHFVLIFTHIRVRQKTDRIYTFAQHLERYRATLIVKYHVCGCRCCTLFVWTPEDRVSIATFFARVERQLYIHVAANRLVLGYFATFSVLSRLVRQCVCSFVYLFFCLVWAFKFKNKKV